VPEKIFVDHDIYWAGKIKGEMVFNLLYREGSQSLTYIKRFTTPKFILDKEYRLFHGHKKSWIQFMQTGEGVRVRIDFIPTTRSKVNSQRLEFDEYLIKGEGAIGKRLSTRTVRRISELTAKVSDQQDANDTENKNIGTKENPSQSPEPEQASTQEKNGEDIQSAAEKKMTKLQLGLFDLKKKE
jgi:topoisomerase-4 subunit A